MAVAIREACSHSKHAAPVEMDDQVTTSSVMAEGSPFPEQIDSESVAAVVVAVAAVVVAAAPAAAAVAVAVGY